MPIAHIKFMTVHHYIIREEKNSSISVNLILKKKGTRQLHELVILHLCKIHSFKNEIYYSIIPKRMI